MTLIPALMTLTVAIFAQTDGGRFLKKETARPLVFPFPPRPALSPDLKSSHTVGCRTEFGRYAIQAAPLQVCAEPWRAEHVRPRTKRGDTQPCVFGFWVEVRGERKRERHLVPLAFRVRAGEGGEKQLEILKWKLRKNLQA